MRVLPRICFRPNQVSGICWFEMDRAVLKKIPLRASPFAGWQQHFRRAIFALFLLQLVLVTVRLFQPQAIFGEARWPEAILLLLATAAAIGSAVRQLPAQNVMLASVIMAFVGSAAHILGALTGIPFGPYVYTNEIGPQLFSPLPWVIPILWILVVFTSRGVGRLILRPWRKTRNYGFWLMGITAALVVLFDFGLEPFATQIKHYWLWHPTHAFIYWYSAPWVNFVGWAATTLVILAFATPSLINKKPVKQPPDYSPLAIWLLLNGFLIAGAIAHQLWLAVAVVAVASVTTSVFAIKGARW